MHRDAAAPPIHQTPAAADSAESQATRNFGVLHGENPVRMAEADLDNARSDGRVKPCAKASSSSSRKSPKCSPTLTRPMRLVPVRESLLGAGMGDSLDQ